MGCIVGRGRLAPVTAWQLLHPNSRNAALPRAMSPDPAKRKPLAESLAVPQAMLMANNPTIGSSFFEGAIAVSWSIPVSLVVPRPTGRERIRRGGCLRMGEEWAETDLSLPY